jgi:hypothetical protein
MVGHGQVGVGMSWSMPVQWKKKQIGSPKLTNRYQRPNSLQLMSLLIGKDPLEKQSGRRDSKLIRTCKHYASTRPTGDKPYEELTSDRKVASPLMEMKVERVGSSAADSSLDSGLSRLLHTRHAWSSSSRLLSNQLTSRRVGRRSRFDWSERMTRPVLRGKDRPRRRL